MEEAKAAAYYDELTRKGEGAARFKQGLGFSSSKPSSSSRLSKFVRASSPTKSEKQAHLQTIQAKLRRSHRSSSPHSRSSQDRDCRSRARDSRNARRSRSPSRISYERDLKKDPLIDGYSLMTPAERVKAKMKLQLSQTAAKDSTMGMSSGWERFDFNKDAPLDDDNDEIEVAEDDASLVKEIGNSFRFSAVQAKREEQIKAAHDEAMFGASAMALAVPESETSRGAEKANNENQDNNLLISDKVLAIQQGSWRDRAGRFKCRFD